MSIEGSGSSAVFWQTQLPIDYIDTSLTIDNWETVSADLSSGRPARLWYVIVEQTNNGATQETLELEITINGTAYTATLTDIDSGQQRYVALLDDLAAGDFSLTNSATGYSFGDNIQANAAHPAAFRTVSLIRVRQTSDVDGTSAQIEVNIVWDKLAGL